jgi:hypothetical protein
MSPIGIFLVAALAILTPTTQADNTFIIPADSTTPARDGDRPSLWTIGRSILVEWTSNFTSETLALSKDTGKDGPLVSWPISVGGESDVYPQVKTNCVLSERDDSQNGRS